jgi:inner membrane protein
LEPITHFLTGACLGRAGFNRKTALTTATMTLAAEAPDIDVLGRFRGSVFTFAHHRGFTHSFLGLLLVSAVVVGFVYGVWRLRGRKTNDPNLPPRWGLLFAYAYLAGLSHILLDFTNNYGVRPFWPFSEKWYSWDIVYIVEPVLLLALVLGLVVPSFAALINAEIGVRQKGPKGQWAARFALIAVVLTWTVRDYEHRRAVNALEARTYENLDPVRVGAYPNWVNPLQWRGVVETKNFFLLANVDSMKPEVDPTGNMEIRYKADETAATLAAKKSSLGRLYLDWAKFPVTETESLADGGYVVRFEDLRFEQVSRGGGPRPLSAGVELDSGLKVVTQFFGRGPQQVAPD